MVEVGLPRCESLLQTYIKCHLLGVRHISLSSQPVACNLMRSWSLIFPGIAVQNFTPKLPQFFDIFTPLPFPESIMFWGLSFLPCVRYPSVNTYSARVGISSISEWMWMKLSTSCEWTMLKRFSRVRPISNRII